MNSTVETRRAESLTNMDKIGRRQFKIFRRGLDVNNYYLEPIVEDAFMFAGPEISEKRKCDYLKALQGHSGTSILACHYDIRQGCLIHLSPCMKGGCYGCIVNR